MNVAALAEGLTLVAGGLILFTYLRRRNAKAEAEKSSAPVSATTPADNTEPDKRTGEGRRRQFLPVVHDRRSGSPRRRCDHPQGGMGNSSTDEVDPLVEADTYLAHGHDEDAEHILKNAIANDPTRHELTIKLLDLYRQHRDQVAFYVLAEELYTALGGRGGELWNRVEGMGRRLNADKPMFEISQDTAPQTEDRHWPHRDRPATKLALAKAYLGRGEMERALSLLEEVLVGRTRG
ncbi:MAG: hypothetical protein E2O38_17105 [Proteobacteria bacterium]|nr:MAG: hypothetical protein E2O38_17105 [Pseudomonadota bacterium]